MSLIILAKRRGIMIVPSRYSPPHIVHFQAPSEMGTGPVEHHPKIRFRDLQQVADLFAGHLIDLAQREHRRRAMRQFAQAMLHGLPELLPVEGVTGISPLLGTGRLVPPVPLTANR